MRVCQHQRANRSSPSPSSRRRSLLLSSASDVFIELILVNDRARVDSYGGDLDRLHDDSVHVANVVQTLFESGGDFYPRVNLVLIAQFDFSSVREPWADTVAFLPDGKIVVTASLAYDPRARLATCHPPVKPEGGGGSESGRRERRREGPPSGGTEEEEGRREKNRAKAAETSFRDVTRRLPPAARAKLPRGVALVKCEPRTGRTHQIRAHLAFLGAPIANDAKYGGERAYGEHGEYGARARASPRGGGGGRSPPGWSLERVARVRAFVEETRCFAADDAEAAEKAAGRWPLCAHCPLMAHRGGEAGDDDLDLEAIWLHCARYSGRGWRFRCPDPPWLPSGEEHGSGEEAPPRGARALFCDVLEEEEEEEEEAAARDGSATRAGNEQSGGR